VLIQYLYHPGRMTNNSQVRVIHAETPNPFLTFIPVNVKTRAKVIITVMTQVYKSFP
jgi:hypothetical protein